MRNEAPIRISEAAVLTGLHPDTLRKYIAKGVLKAVKTPSGERRVYPSALDKLWSEPRSDNRQAAESRAIGRKFFDRKEVKA